MEAVVLPSKSAILLRALLNLVLGAILLIWPGITLLVLIYAFALNILLVGIVTLFEPAFGSKKGSFVSVILGLIGIVVGIYLVAKPGVTAELIALLIGIWALLYGIVDIYLGFSGKGAEKGNWLFVVVGIVSVLLGILVLSSPLTTILSIVWLIGWYSVVVGLVLGVTGLLFYPKSK